MRAYGPPAKVGLFVIYAAGQETNYQELLRAIGRMLDRERFKRFRLIEGDDGLILQVMTGTRRFEFETYLLTREDIAALIEDTYRLRNRGTAQEGP